MVEIGKGVDILLLHKQQKEPVPQERPGGTPARWMGAPSTLGNENCALIVRIFYNRWFSFIPLLSMPVCQRG